jgi:hypothetical protein
MKQQIQKNNHKYLITFNLSSFMNKSSKRASLNAASEAMEQRPFQNNGTSPKSQTSKGNYNLSRWSRNEAKKVMRIEFNLNGEIKKTILFSIYAITLILCQSCFVNRYQSYAPTLQQECIGQTEQYILDKFGEPNEVTERKTRLGTVYHYYVHGQMGNRQTDFKEGTTTVTFNENGICTHIDTGTLQSVRKFSLRRTLGLVIPTASIVLLYFYLMDH